MRVADLRFRPPPTGGQTLRAGQVGRCGADERIDVVEDGGTLSTNDPGTVSIR